MIFAIDNGELVTDLDCQGFDILNVGSISPPPDNLVSTDDPRLSDARFPLEGSVTNMSVAVGAGIVQSKLALDGQIPAGWLGNTATTAAFGNIVEYKANKGVPLGYASLDSTGKVPSSQLPGAVGTGTVTSVTLNMPAAEFDVTGNPVTTSGTITVAWDLQLAGAWFGNSSGSAAVPTFNTGPLPLSLIPSLDASKITSGVISAALLPIAVGVGVSHAPGAVPDPGTSGNPTDYLARDMTFQPVPSIGPSYQPVVPDPIISSSTGPAPFTVSITSTLPGTSLFYSISSSVFTPVPDNGIVTLQLGQTVSAFGANAGYTNSSIVTLLAPAPLPTENVETGDPSDPSELVLGDDSNPVTVG